MALKGTTRIELINVKTGEKEVIEKDNLVTNAVAAALDDPFTYRTKCSYSSATYIGNSVPICPNLIGGILLFEDALIENPDQYYAQADNPIVGYSSNIVNDKTDVMRGSMNLNESGVLDSNDGYRFVFDFTTAQANGTISAVALTSKWGGMAGYGSTLEKNTQSPKVYCAYDTSNYDTNKTVERLYALASALHYDEETGIATSVYVVGQNSIAVDRIKLHTKEWRLVRNMSPLDFLYFLDTNIVETKIFAGSTVTGRTRNYVFCDGQDGYVWGFEHSGGKGGNSSGNTTVNWIKIKLEDLSIEEGTWDIAAQLSSFGYRLVDFSDLASGSYYVEDVNAAVLDGYLYCPNYSKTGIYKIKLSNVTDVTFIEHPDKKIDMGSSQNSGSKGPYYGQANITVFGNRICLRNGWLNGDTIVPISFSSALGAPGGTSDDYLRDGWIFDSNIGGYPYYGYGGMYNLKSGVFSMKFDKYSNNAYFTLLLASPYLATINNLPTPVQKTADKTMKITYILREE